MVLWYVLLIVYILAVNFYGFRLVKEKRDAEESGERSVGDAKLFLAAALGGAIAVYAAMFCMRYRLTSLVLMVGMPLLAVLNLYCFYLGFRSVWLFL